jgi:hypothetical protein
MRKRIKELLINALDEVEYRLRLLCGNPSPVKRMIVILILGVALLVASIHFIVSSIYNMGKYDAQMELLQMQHIKSIEPQKKSECMQTNEK